MESPGRYSMNSENFSDMLSRVRDEDVVDDSTDVIDLIRAKWISQRVKDRHAEFTDVKTHSFMVTTYNLNGKSPKEYLANGVDFNDWLFKTDQFYDFYVIGFQEMVDLNAANVVLNLESGRRAREWNPLLLETVNRRASSRGMDFEYFEIASQTLVGVHIVILAKLELRPFIRFVRWNVHKQNAAVGIGGVLGNKGGSAIRFRFLDSTFCFICSHLAAHRNAVGARNANVFSIVEKLSLRGQQRANTVTPRTPSESGATSLPFFVDLANSKEIHPFDHDYVVWLGDLNYRIDSSLSVEAVNEQVDSGDFSVLRAMDQLNMERDDGRVFEGFLEGVLEFPPTYKFNPKTDEYERRPEKKQRAPAWCDRVLWKDSRLAYGLGAHSIDLTSYSCSRIITSDHKPVIATFDIGVSKVSGDKYQRIIGELTRELDAEENSAIPKCELDVSSIEIGELKFYERKEVQIKIRNVGSSMATFRFVPKFGEALFSKRWIMVASDSVGGLLKAGDTGIITIRFEVNATTIRDVDRDTLALSDILILRVLNGADSFIAVSGTLKPTCFGKSLEELLLRDEAGTGQTVDTAEAGPPLLIPRYVWQLCDMMFFQCNLETPCLFRKAASLDQKRAICEWLENPGEGNDVDHCDINAYLAVFADFLMALQSPVIPRRLLPTGPIEPSKLQAWCKDLLEALDVPSYNLFMYVISFLRELLRHQQENLLDTQHAARVATTFLAQIPMGAVKKAALNEAANAAAVGRGGGGSSRSVLAKSSGSGSMSHLGRRGVSAGHLLQPSSPNFAPAAAAVAAGPDLSVAFEQMCVALEFFLEFDGVTTDGAGSSDIAGQLAAEAGSTQDVY